MSPTNRVGDGGSLFRPPGWMVFAYDCTLFRISVYVLSSFDKFKREINITCDDEVKHDWICEKIAMAASAEMVWRRAASGSFALNARSCTLNRPPPNPPTMVGMKPTLVPSHRLISTSPLFLANAVGSIFLQFGHKDFNAFSGSSRPTVVNKQF